MYSHPKGVSGSTTVRIHSSRRYHVSKVDPLVSRVARLHVVRQHQAQLILRGVPAEEPLQVEFSDAGRITSSDIKRLLEPTCGWVMPLHFHRSVLGPASVSFDGITHEGEIVRGEVKLRTQVTTLGIAVWAEVEIEFATTVLQQL